MANYPRELRSTLAFPKTTIQGRFPGLIPLRITAKPPMSKGLARDAWNFVCYRKLKRYGDEATFRADECSVNRSVVGSVVFNYQVPRIVG